MSSRRLRAYLTAAAICASALTLVGSANALDCASVTDGTGDATSPFLPSDPHFDLTRASLRVDASNVTAVLKVRDLSRPQRATTERFELAGQLDGAALTIYAQRPNPTEAGQSGQPQFAVLKGFSYAGTNYPDAATPSYNDTEDTVTIQVSMSTLASAVGKPVLGLTVSSLKGIALEGLPTNSPQPRDETPASESFRVAVCSDGAGSVPLPVDPGDPVANCSWDVEEAGDDSGYYAPGTSTRAHRDDRIDIDKVTFGTKAGSFVAVVHFAAFNDKTVSTLSPRVDFKFTHNNRSAIFIWANPSTDDPYRRVAEAATRPKTFPIYTHQSAGTTWTVEQAPPLGVEVDTGSRTVKFWMPLSYLEDTLGAPIGRGTRLTSVQAVARVLSATAANTQDGNPWVWSGEQDPVLDQAPNSSQTYTIGSNSCFPQPASQLTNLAATTQYGDLARLSVKLSSAANSAPISGAPVKFELTSLNMEATGTTDGNGIARVTIPHGKEKGVYPLTVTFAGNNSWGDTSISGNMVVNAETTLFVKPLRVVKSGAVRTVYATLRDNDSPARNLANMTVKWYVNNRLIASSRTNASGVASFNKGKPGQTVKAVFSAIANRYAGCQASVRLP